MFVRAGIHRCAYMHTYGLRHSLTRGHMHVNVELHVHGDGACTRRVFLNISGFRGVRGGGGLITASLTQTVAYRLPC